MDSILWIPHFRNSPKTTRQKYKMYSYFYRTGIALLEYYFTFNFCRVVIEKFGFKVTLRYGTHMVWEQVR